MQGTSTKIVVVSVYERLSRVEHGGNRATGRGARKSCGQDSMWLRFGASDQDGSESQRATRQRTYGSVAVSATSSSPSTTAIRRTDLCSSVSPVSCGNFSSD
jgi:hypothetical protein